MGLFFTLIYILASYLSPDVVFGALAEYRMELIIAVLAMFTSLLSLKNADLLRTPQTYALGCISAAVLLSFVFNGLFGLAPTALLTFLPQAFTFLLIYINCKRKSHLQMVTLVLLFCSLFTVYKGYQALQIGLPGDPYLYNQGHEEEGNLLFRIRGLGTINDPNDFAQLLVATIPCMFLFWRPGSLLWNLPVVLAPVGVLIYGMYLTHSRGGILALLAVIFFVFRKKIGTVLSGIIAGGGLVGALAAGFSGGRDISVESGADRLEAWSTGLELIKSHPLFGVGFQRFTEYYIITAHNTVVVCAAELGVIGLFFWVMFVLPTVRDLAVTLRPAVKEAKRKEDSPYAYLRETARTDPVSATAPAAPSDEEELPAHLRAGEEAAPVEEAEVRRLARILLASMIGFLTTAWFLSRAYVMTLFVFVGMAAVVYRMAEQQGITLPRLPRPRLFWMTSATTIGLVSAVYVILRLQHLMPH